ncbi:hypothetical protein L195_g011965 [Trifolium pratense]|uniref:Uncharacterized protein n=1 Tax=Trifolium pratense TaxID=57577 RepID=A0A2K3PJ08_TRIPR|nr:hypothetical protein L195_g011965 [Trifolium pratense]
MPLGVIPAACTPVFYMQSFPCSSSASSQSVSATTPQPSPSTALSTIDPNYPVSCPTYFVFSPLYSSHASTVLFWHCKSTTSPNLLLTAVKPSSIEPTLSSSNWKTSMQLEFDALWSLIMVQPYILSREILILA